MKRIFKISATTVTMCLVGLAIAYAACDASYQNKIYMAQGGSEMKVCSGATVTLESGSSLVLASTSSLQEGNVDYAAKSLTATYGVVGATGAFTGAVDIAGQVTMGAAGSKSTAATTGDISVGRDLAVARNADVTGQFATGAAGTKSTVTTTGDLSLARDINVGRNADITGTLTWGAAGTRSTSTAAGVITVAGSVTAPAITGSTSVSGAKVTVSAGPLTLYSRAKAQILALTPTAAGEAYYCSDCTAVTVCVSTGTGAGAFVKVDDRSAACD